MPTDRRLFDSSAMTPPPAPEVDAVTCTVDQGYMPEPASYPLLKRLQALREMDRALSTPSTDNVDEILHHIRIHGEAIIRFAGDRYRITFDAAGNVRSERLNAEPDPLIDGYARARAQIMRGDVDLKPALSGDLKRAYDRHRKSGQHPSSS